MVQIWFMDNEQTDQRLEHKRSPPKYLELSELYKKTGVEYFKINADDYLNDKQLSELRTTRGYTYEDEITCSEKCLPDYANKLKSFYTEHLHTDEEIRLVLDGSGYFDVRDGDDNWLRIQVIKGDMIIIPAGIYHRFTLDTNNFIRAVRYFIGEPVWLPHNRPADDMDCRKAYLQNLGQLGKA
ncbi:1,2-dihydroxy-3-keto-5-methylthiopentene dioxygenase [Drosophila innubila]|uniref:1,2-dihydroxy-3-keto-5-methylthiopentene dioxygenase n=1 Tax=Drosophila innubila TaxID=198719 RepID=UPI00148BDAB0|nr:1,2-dihydroxy-3-keto-5-methylthiopentene dioxygenase [Drosophila innubila]